MDNDYYIAYYFEIKGELLFDMAKYREANLYFDSAIVLFDGLINSAETGSKSCSKIQTRKNRLPDR